MIDLFEKKIPIYMQLIELFKQLIVSGKWPQGVYIESVRDLAMTYQVNPNTVFKALSELEQQGLLINDRTIGKKVTEDTHLIEQTKKETLLQAIQEFLDQIKELGYSVDEVCTLIKGKGERL